MTSRTTVPSLWRSLSSLLYGLLVAAWLPGAMAAPTQESEAGASLVVVADPQIHNVAGGSVKQTFLISDWGTKVAQRYPELNLLAGYVFKDLVRRADHAPLGTDSGLVLLLGDGTNAACTGEYDRFDKQLQSLRDNGKLVLWAHGNHDSYLMGTTNSYLPSFENRSALEEMARSDWPIDKSWWKPLATPLNWRKAWNSVCADGHGSVPMNKGQWIARYLKSFGKSLVQSSERSGDGILITGHGAPGTRLESLNFQVSGRWYPPDLSRRQRKYLRQPYSSYIIQAIDVGQHHRLVLIDTSVCVDTGFAASFFWKNAGSRSCLSQEELRDIAKVTTSSGRRLVFAGHFPLHKLDKDIRRELLEIFNASKQPWSYLSGHTHEPESWHIAEDGTPYSGDESSHRYDLNIGSTTDWPMEAHRIMLDDSEQGMKSVSVGYLGAPRLVYSELPKYDGWEICRHLKVAQELANVPVRQPFQGPWKPEVTNKDYKACEEMDYVEAVIKLDTALQTIDENMADDDYRDAMLRIAISASHAENGQNWLGKYIVIP